MEVLIAIPKKGDSCEKLIIHTAICVCTLPATKSLMPGSGAEIWNFIEIKRYTYGYSTDIRFTTHRKQSFFSDTLLIIL